MEKTRALLVWQKYAQLKSQSKIIRSGFGLLGVYPYDLDRPQEVARSESDLEHVAGTMILASLISVYYPEVIPFGELPSYLLLLMHHEIGEAAIGDVPDDGGRDEIAKNRAELAVMRQYCQDLPENFGLDLKVNFMELQHQAYPRGQIAYCIDKLEAILQGLLYERDGRGGDMAKKRAAGCLSLQDQRYMDKTGTSSLVDNWSAHMIDKIQDMKCASIFIEILCTAVEAVRGHRFDWL